MRTIPSCLLTDPIGSPGGYIEDLDDDRAILPAHPNVRRMRSLLRRQFYWPSLRADVHRHVRDCSICSRSQVGKRVSHARIHLAATAIESLSKARALRTKPCQRAAEGPSSTAWTRHHTLARGPKALNRLLLPAPATKQEPPTEGTAQELEQSRLCPFECIHYKISMRTARPLQAGLRRL